MTTFQININYLLKSLDVAVIESKSLNKQISEYATGRANTYINLLLVSGYPYKELSESVKEYMSILRKDSTDELHIHELNQLTKLLNKAEILSTNAVMRDVFTKALNITDQILDRKIHENEAEQASMEINSNLEQ